MIEKLVRELPEVYQPIYGHPELSERVSRPCEDRLQIILQIHDALRARLRRPLKILDLGCAQGYFSFSLAKRGATVYGVDFLDKNISVCNALKAENTVLQVRFETGRIEEIIGNLEQGQFDIVLGLSLFHHIAYEHGADAVKAMLNHAAERSGVLILEFALREEPLYWASAQPEDPFDFLEGVAFVHEVARHGTHLAPIARPLVVASNRYWILDDRAFDFERWSSESHALANGAHRKTRRYFFNSEFVLKMYEFGSRGEYNRSEYKKEIQFLSAPPLDFPAPLLNSFAENETGAWLVMQRLPGRLLLDLLREGVDVDCYAVVAAVLHQLAVLEAAGLYHADVRTWNVIVEDGGAVSLIDYGSISPYAKDCVWPENIFFSFLIFVKEVITGVVDDPNPLRSISICPYGFPQPYRAWVETLWRSPLKDWSFQLMHQTLQSATGSESEGPLTHPQDAWMKAIEEAIQAQKIYAQDLNFRLEAKAQQAEAKAQQAEAKAQQAEAKAQQAEAKAQQAEAKFSQIELVSDQYVAQLNAVINSKSWRITAPLRKLRKFLRPCDM